MKNFSDFWPNRIPYSLTLPKTNVYYNLEVSAKRYPKKTAIVYYGTKISYEQLLDNVNRMAGFLQRELEVSKGDRVILYMQNSPQFLVGFYALLRVGATIVPVNPMNVTSELSHYVEDSGAKVALVGQELYGQISPFIQTGSLENIVVGAYSDYLEMETDLAMPDVVTESRQKIGDEHTTLWSKALECEHPSEPVETVAEDMVLLPYTSGSTTGTPKGCIHTHYTLHATLIGAAVWNTMTSDSVVLCTLPLFHVTGLQHSMNASIYCGSTIVLMTRWDKTVAADLIQRHGCSHWTNISTMVVDFLSNPEIGKYDLSTLGFVGGGGASLPASIGEKLHELTGLRYVEGYGLSETIAQTHMNPPDRPKLQCLGVPSFDVDSRIINPETLEELGPNQEGEIVSNGPQVMSGYWNRPDANDEAFTEIDGKRFLRTGDIGMYDEEGYFFMVDRLKRMINAGGYNVWPSEVESVLYQHPAVQEAVVIGVPDERRGETAKAIVVLQEEEREKVTPEEIIEWSKDQMAAYKYPRIVEFTNSLPRSGSGKILWRELQEQEQQANSS
jgi:fatty-acyl-CoA synthase